MLKSRRGLKPTGGGVCGRSCKETEAVGGKRPSADAIRLPPDLWGLSMTAREHELVANRQQSRSSSRRALPPCRMFRPALARRALQPAALARRPDPRLLHFALSCGVILHCLVLCALLPLALASFCFRFPTGLPARSTRGIYAWSRPPASPSTLPTVYPLSPANPKEPSSQVQEDQGKAKASNRQHGHRRHTTCTPLLL